MRFRYKTILAFIPKNKDGELILNQALYFQQALGIRIFVLNIIKVFSILPNKFRIKKILKLKNNALHELKKFVKNTLQKELPGNVILRIKFGNIVQNLINESRKGGYEFIIIDKSKGNYKGVLTRSQVNKIVSRSYCPVLLLNRELHINEINTIIVPVDITQTTKKRLLWASLFAKIFNARIQIVSTLTVDIDETKSFAYRNAEKIRKMLNERGVECDIKILKVHNQKKHNVILNYIEEQESCMVIIRTHQESIFSGAKIGKFVSEIIHGCKVPVFTVGDSKQILLTDFEEYTNI
jgi:nucleotide-binding universal stress UspA family protein